MGSSHADLEVAAALEPRDARRRRQLIEAAITSIAENGLSGTTVAKVAALAGLSTGIVNFYFGGKDALLLATLEHVDREFARRQEDAARLAGDDPVRLLDAMVEVEFDPDVCNPRWTAVWNAFWGEARAREDYKRVCGSREQAQESQVVDLFRQIAETGGHRQLHPEALGRAFYHLLSSLPENVLGGHEPFDFEDAKTTCRAFLTSVFPDEFSEFSNFADSDEHARSTPDLELEHQYETLPTWVYHDPEFFELELEHIFRKNWLLVGHVSEAPGIGDYITLDVAHDRVFVIRDSDGRLRAFDNVCRHRASRVVKGDVGTCSGTIVCPFHGWSYGFDGRLRGVPAEGSFRDLEKSQIALPELELEEWMGFVFVRFGGDGPAVSEQMAEFADEAAHYRFDEMKPWGRRSNDLFDFNWKVFVENDAEGHHIATGHPGLRRLFGTSYTDDVLPSGGGRAHAVLQEAESSGWSERMYQRILPEVESLPPELRRAWTYYGLFPTAVMQIGPEMVGCYQVLPAGPEQCRIHGFQIAHEDPRREMRAARYLSDRIVRQVVKEDVDFCTWTNGGVRSTSYSGGFLSEHESGVAAFQNRIRELIPVANLVDRPAPGEVARIDREMAREGADGEGVARLT